MPKNMDFFVFAIEQIKGLKSSGEAMKACGMQPELAAHIMLQCASLKKSIILRAGTPPIYNQKRGAKSGWNLTKTSNQGLFKGSIAADQRFTRIKNGKAMGHLGNDRSRLYPPYDLHHPEYQHTVPLPVTMQDILRELSPDGDLEVLGYENGKLRLRYKPGKGDPNFHGQFIIDLLKADAPATFYSRPWDNPKNHPEWDEQNQIIKKPKELHFIPDEEYQKAFSNLFTVSFAEHQEIPTDEDMEIAYVFANTPRTSSELLNIIHESQLFSPASKVMMDIAGMGEDTPMQEILALFSKEEIKALYDHCGLATTGDWDGLLLGNPSNEDLEGFPADKMRVYNTFMRGVNGIIEREEFKETCLAYIDYLKKKPELALLPIGHLLRSVTKADLISIFNDSSIKRAGCVTPYEFVFTQLINYSYQDPDNKVYGEHIEMRCLQNSLDAALKTYHELSKNLETPKIFERCLNIALAHYQFEISHLRYTEHSQINAIDPELINKHLQNHLKIALSKGAQPYKIPHPHYDHNIHQLFQHGFEIRNPYGAHLEGAWFMITDQGYMLYGDTEEQLTSTLVLGDFLKYNLIDVPANANMDKGWGNVIHKQLSLKQCIPPKTLELYQTWRSDQMLSPVYCEQPPEKMRMDLEFLKHDVTLMVDEVKQTESCAMDLVFFPQFKPVVPIGLVKPSPLEELEQKFDCAAATP